MYELHKYDMTMWDHLFVIYMTENEFLINEPWEIYRN